MGNHRATRSDRRRLVVTPLQSLTPARPARAGARSGGARIAERGTSRPERPATGAGNGRRRAAKTVNPLVRVLPSAPILVGVTALAVSTGGAVAAASQPALTGSVTSTSGLSAAASIGARDGVEQAKDRAAIVSRDTRRRAQAEAQSEELAEEAEEQAAQRSETIQAVNRKAAAQSAKIEANQWVLPLGSYSITARFGQYGLWASYHTGLDFNGNTGDPIMAVANGTVTEVGYDGAYGNKTVVTLEDGTEIWFCHQTSMYVSPGDAVTAGEVIGTVGSTGNVTGSHLHLEVRPGGGDPVDPAAAFAAQGITP